MKGYDCMNNKKEYRFDTMLLHGGFRTDSDTHSMVTPIYQTTAYLFDSTQDAADIFELKKEGNIYTRLSNPTTDAFNSRISELEGGAGALSFSSGHAALYAAFLNLCDTGDEIVSSSSIYGGAVSMLANTVSRLGIKTVFVNADDLDEWENAITDRTRCLFVEAVGNPNANISDIEAIAAIAHSHDIPLIVDSTFTTPYLMRPFDFGADIVIHSATKYLGGHGNAMGGVVVDSGKFPFLNNKRFSQYNDPDEAYHGAVFARDFDLPFLSRLGAVMLRDLGACQSPFNSFLLLQGIQTLALRMQRHSENALAVARYLDSHPLVEKVNHAGLETSPYHGLAEKYLPKGIPAIFTFELKGGREAGAKFIDSLKLFSHVANVGDTRSLVIHPATTTHGQLSEEQLMAGNITSGTVRLSIGIEDINDIIDDIDHALSCTVL